MILLAGLGNPGAKYENNRHNVGFLALDEIARRHGFGPWRAKFQGEVSEGKIGTDKVLLLKPQTYMNESGRSVGELCRFYKIPTEDLVVFHDELDLPGGKLRVKTGGGHGGHNGLRSIDAHLGQNYTRVRIGIGHPGDKARVYGHVLSDFSKAERTGWADPLIDEIAREAGYLVQHQGPEFMNRIALSMKPVLAKLTPKPGPNQAKPSDKKDT